MRVSGLGADTDYLHFPTSKSRARLGPLFPIVRFPALPVRPVARRVPSARRRPGVTFPRHPPGKRHGGEGAAARKSLEPPGFFGSSQVSKSH